MLGLGWADGGRLEAQVRARRDRGAWTPWVPLHRAGDHAPDGARAIAGTEPAWTDSADVFQLRLRGRAAGVRVRFVRAKPTASVSRGVGRRLRRRASARAAQVPLPTGTTPPPRIISRAEWGAASVPPRSAAGYGEVAMAFVHHTVTANDYGPEDSAAIVLGIARYHRDSNGWNDVGYNFLVDKYGQVFEGRAGGIALAVIGAQAQGYNSVSTGIACLGDFSALPQSDAGLAAVAQLVAWKLALHGVPVQGEVTVTSQGGASNRYRAGTPVTFQRIAGHRDGDATSCPGEALYAQLPAIRAAAAARTGGAGASALSVAVATRRVRYPSRVRLTGRLRFADGASGAGAPLALEYQAPGGAWSPVGAVSCGADGQWAAEIAVPASGLVRAVFAGDRLHPPLATSPAAVTVLPRLTLRLSARRVRVRAAIRVTGTLAPAPAGGRALCVVERQVGRRWVTVTRKRINVRANAFSTVVRPRRAGLHRVTVSTPGETKRLAVRVTAR
jgi:hypothetical protein